MGKLKSIEDVHSVDKPEEKLEEGRTETVDSSQVPTDFTLGTQDPEEGAIAGPQFPGKDEIEAIETVIVTWNGPDDPENPKRWPSKKKIFNVTVISMMTFLCPLCSAIFVRPLFRCLFIAIGTWSSTN
jgi:hypothetical protein